jgi:adenosylcobinamide hydrolase
VIFVPSVAGHSDDGAGAARPVLVWRFADPVRCISSGVFGGGLGDRSWLVNAEVDDAYHLAPAAHLRRIGAELGLAGAGVGLLTAAPVRRFRTGDDAGAECVATVGLSVPTWAAAPDGASSAWRPGTINLVCWVPAPLDDAALVNTVITATEAKTQALVEAGVPGTGTASDAVVVCCPPGGGEVYGGPRSTWGARLARAVHAAVAPAR